MSAVPAQSRNNGEDDEQTARPDLTVVTDSPQAGHISLELDVVGDPATGQDHPDTVEEGTEQVVEAPVAEGNTECRPPTWASPVEADPTRDDDEGREAELDVVEDDNPVSSQNPQTVSARAAIRQPNAIVRWYMQYFWALIRFAVDNQTNQHRMARGYYEDSMRTFNEAIFGVVARDRMLTVTLEQAQADLAVSINELNVTFNGTSDFHNVIPNYPTLVWVNELSEFLPGRPSVGPWWVFPIRPLLRRAAFSWLNRQYQLRLKHTA